MPWKKITDWDSVFVELVSTKYVVTIYEAMRPRSKIASCDCFRAWSRHAVYFPLSMCFGPASHYSVFASCSTASRLNFIGFTPARTSFIIMIKNKALPRGLFYEICTGHGTYRVNVSPFKRHSLLEYPYKHLKKTIYFLICRCRVVGAKCKSFISKQRPC